MTSMGRSCVASTLTSTLAQRIAIGAIGKWGTRVTRRKLYLAASTKSAYALSATSAAMSWHFAVAWIEAAAPIEKPITPIRLGSTSGLVLTYWTAPSTSLVSWW